MAAFNFTTVDDRNFALNSRAYPSIYMARQFDNDPGFIEIVEKDNQLSHLIERERIGNISIDGKSNWASAEELQVALNSQLKIGNFKSPGSGGGSGSGSASDVTVNQSGFETISGSNVQAVLNDIDDKLTEGAGIPEAPEDGKQYGRQDGSWTEITGSGDEGVPEAPEDGKLYGRQNGAWAEVPDTGTAVTYDQNGNILAGEALLGQFSDGVETWGNQSTNTSIASSDRPEVINPPQGVKQTIENPSLLPWANGNSDFKDPSPRGWRIPSRDEIIAIDTSGRGGWTQLNGINGRYFGGGENIFFPAGGSRNIAGTVGGRGIGGVYWSSTPENNELGYDLFFVDVTVDPVHHDGYNNGLSVRCVRDTATTDFEPCPAGEYQIGSIVWAKSNLSDVGKFALTPETYGAYFQWGQAIAIGGDGEPLSVKHKIAYLEDIPTPAPSARFNVTNMFTFNPAVPDAKVWMRDDGQQKPEIEIIANHSGDDVNDLIITAASGFGSWYDMTGRKALQVLGRDIDTGASGIYDVSITGETDISQTIITVPKEVDNFHGIYFLGKTQAPRASYWTESRTGVTYPFELDNTPISDLCPDMPGAPHQSAIRINGQWINNHNAYPPLTILDLVFGSSYNTITEIPGTATGRGFLTSMGDYGGVLDISGLKNVSTYGDFSFFSINFRILQIRDIDANTITTVGESVFATRSIRGIYADTHAGGEAFKAKFPELSQQTEITITVNT